MAKPTPVRLSKTRQMGRQNSLGRVERVYAGVVPLPRARLA